MELDIIGPLNWILALGTVLLQVATVALVVALIFRKQSPVLEGIVEAVSRRTLLIAFVVSFAASFLTLVYSDVFGYEPCPLCWWQRIFLYPQVILFGMALWKRDLYIADYALVLSILGAGVALYHHALQMLPAGVLPCPATVEGVSCAQRIIFEFGYVTFPMMAVGVFVFLLVLSIIMKRKINT